METVEGNFNPDSSANHISRLIPVMVEEVGTFSGDTFYLEEAMLE